MILDTCILIEILKGNEKIANFLQSQKCDFFVSSISEMELYFSAINKKETKELENFLTLFKSLHINENISKKATNLIKTYAKSHSLTLPDALIASTSLSYDLPLFTLNLKDFRYIDGVKLVKVNL